MPSERKAATVELYLLGDDGRIPNNERLPLIVYRGVLPQAGDRARACETLFQRHGWGDGWRNGIFPYHHFHSTAHEALGIVAGDARVRFGGAGGETVELRQGDVVVIPAGVGHKRESASADLLVIGAYPKGQDVDLCIGKPGERETAQRNIPHVALPEMDPVYGKTGPLIEEWRG